MIVTEKQASAPFDDIIQQIVKGKVLAPNYKEVTLEAGVANIAAGGGLKATQGVGNAKIPNDDSSWGHWARYFLGTTQSGAYDGTGYVMWYDNGKGRIGTFAVCKHVKVAGAGASPARGWSPGRCKLCGLDMTVDSGD